MNTKTDAELLSDAADLIEAGWCQGQSRKYPADFSHGTQRCLTAALTDACAAMQEPQVVWVGAYYRVLNAVGREVVGRAFRPLTDSVAQLAVMGMVQTWNDVRGRTKEEVAAVVRNAKRWLAP